MVYRLNIKIEYFNIICSVKSLSFIHPALHFARWEAKFSDTRVNSLVLNGYYKRKLAVTSAVVVLLCRLISLFLNFIFYSSVNNAQSWRRNVGGSYKYYTWVVFRSSHFGNSSILSFHFFYYPKCETRRLYEAKRSCFSSFAKRDFMQNSVEIFIANCQNLFLLLLKLFYFVGSRWFGHSHIMKSFCLLMDHLSRYVCSFSLPLWIKQTLNHDSTN